MQGKGIRPRQGAAVGTILRLDNVMEVASSTWVVLVILPKTVLCLMD
jgi:hypothetical protein